MLHRWRYGLVCLLSLAACDSESFSEVQATQDGAPLAGRRGTGVMEPVGFDLPDGSIKADDMVVMIRSFEPEECSQIDSYDPFLTSPEGFSWLVFMSVPAAKLKPGATFHFSEVLSSIDTAGHYAKDSPLSDWNGDSGCDLTAGDDPRVDVLEVSDKRVVIRLTDACAADWGYDIPMEEQQEGHVPPPAVQNHLDGEYEITLCQPSPAGGGS